MLLERDDNLPEFSELMDERNRAYSMLMDNPEITNQSQQALAYGS